MSQDSLFSNRLILAHNVKELRLKSNIKREELSLALGFDNSYISKLEKCKINITIDKLTMIANYFSIEIIDLFKI
jgi:transcriptional regulator with XRE-family HTH domain